jgi:hypothetical protein
LGLSAVEDICVNPEAKAEKEIELLLHESEQLHDNVQRNMNEMNKLLALAFPAITAAFALVSEGKWLEVNGAIYALFCFLASLLVVMFNNVWMQLLGFTRYKYGDVLPRLYQLTGRPGLNFGEFAIRRGIVRPMVGAIVVQVLLLPMAFVALYDAVYAHEATIFRYPAFISTVLALVTTAVSWYVAWEVVSEVKTNAVKRGVLKATTTAGGSR